MNDLTPYAWRLALFAGLVGWFALWAMRWRLYDFAGCLGAMARGLWR